MGLGVTDTLVVSLALAIPCNGQSPSSKIELTPQQVVEIRSCVDTFKKKYQIEEIGRGSPDYDLFERIAVAALVEPEFVDDLIDLTAIKMEKPNTTEDSRPIDLSPAASQLVMLGESCRNRIEERLAGAQLTEWQRQVFSGVLQILAMDREKTDFGSASFRINERRKLALAKLAKGENVTSWPELDWDALNRAQAEASQAPPAEGKSWISRPVLWGAILAAGAVLFMWLWAKIRK